MGQKVRKRFNFLKQHKTESQSEFRQTDRGIERETQTDRQVPVCGGRSRRNKHSLNL